MERSILHHLDAGETYTYLGVEQRGAHEVGKVKDAVRGKYRRRLQQIWSSEMSGRNKASTTNMLAIPILHYSLELIMCTLEELRQLDIGIRKMMHIHRSFHPKASVPRLYLPKHREDHGTEFGVSSWLMVLEEAFKMIKSSDPLFCLVYEQAEIGSFMLKALRRAADSLGFTSSNNSNNNKSNRYNNNTSSSSSSSGCSGDSSRSSR